MIRLGIVGTNTISDWCVGAVRAADAGRESAAHLQPAAVFSRDAHRGAEFAARHGIGRAVDSLESLFPLVDAVYVASPTAVHADQALAAIAAGKHVLVEKTMAHSASAVEQIFAAADAAGVVAMEATRHLYHPAFAVWAEAVRSVGAVRYAHLEMLQYSSRYDAVRAGEYRSAFDPATGNSALVDIGVYCLEAALDVWGEPRAHSGASVHLANGFEAGGALHLDYADAVVEVAYSKIVQGVSPSVVVAEDGVVSIDSLAEPSRITRTRRGGEEEVLYSGLKPAPVDTMPYELLAFAAQVRGEASDGGRRAVTRGARRIMDQHLARVTPEPVTPEVPTP